MVKVLTDLRQIQDILQSPPRGLYCTASDFRGGVAVQDARGVSIGAQIAAGRNGMGQFRTGRMSLAGWAGFLGVTVAACPAQAQPLIERFALRLELGAGAMASS